MSKSDNGGADDGGAPSSPRRHPRDSAATRARILAAARAEFAERGFEGARIDRIAQRAEANKRLLYAYFGNKDALYAAVLTDAYREIREGEAGLKLDADGPQEAMARLVRFTFRHFMEKPWFISLLTTENLHQARILKALPDIEALNSPLIKLIETLLARGVETGVFRRGVDPVQLYISIAALGYFYTGNRFTLSVAFGRDLAEPAAVQEREDHAVEMVLGYLAGPENAP